MEELIFFGLIIIFSLIDGLVRKRRQSQQPEVPEEGTPAEWLPDSRSSGSPPTYDRDASYDDVDTTRSTESARRPPPGHRGRVGGEIEARHGTAVPSDLWEEIAALARGERPTPDTSPPGEPALGGRPSAAPIQRGEVGTHADLFEHPVHRSHAGYGTDPSSRAQTVVLGHVERESADVSAVKGMLAGGRNQLRRAVILQEMLGPPVSLREPDDPGR